MTTTGGEGRELAPRQLTRMRPPPDSDVDVLVVSDDSRSDLRDGLDAIAFDLAPEFRRAVAFILYPA